MQHNICAIVSKGSIPSSFDMVGWVTGKASSL